MDGQLYVAMSRVLKLQNKSNLTTNGSFPPKADGIGWGEGIGGGGMEHSNSVTTFPRIPLFQVALTATRKHRGTAKLYHVSLNI